MPSFILRLLLVTFSAAKTVLLVGAGPVALTLVARYLNEKNNTLPYQFKIIENRAEYTASSLANTQRLQMLAIWKENYLKLPVEIRRKLLQKGCFRNSPLVLAPAYCYTSTDPETFPDNLVFEFIMKDYEEILKRYIESKASRNEVEFIAGEFMGIDREDALIYNKATNKRLNLKYTVIIGADGARSSVRDKVFQVKCNALPVALNYGGALTYKASHALNHRLTDCLVFW